MRTEQLLITGINSHSENFLFFFCGLWIVILLLILSFIRDDGKKKTNDY